MSIHDIFQQAFVTSI